ncbi:hypothetical protein MTR67_030630 [Solanum verrucosum]|uniref:Reverse transcriptase zinc-binding domain-containing protein n=1 Tax=Solanum verrucosum TaxID=315347 RepID=A0AAF0RCY1_SOLVR|nr:hypothetical protein MTR67_030630 [Solanum verrucosum]
MRGSMERVEWRKLVWANLGAPKWLFILYIALNRRLLTKGRLAQGGLTEEVTCSLCQTDDEDIDHLFFKWSYAEKVWSKLLGWQGIQRQIMNWQEEVRWAVRNMKGKISKMKVYQEHYTGCGEKEMVDYFKRSKGHRKVLFNKSYKRFMEGDPDNLD